MKRPSFVDRISLSIPSRLPPLSTLIDDYRNIASVHYKNNPEGLSLMHLCGGSEPIRGQRALGHHPDLDSRAPSHLCSL
jgi:hypothetical protein